jgi:hypothetical protein
MTFEQMIQEISTLSIEQRKALIMAIVDTLAEPSRKKRSILEFEGIAAHLADGEDPQKYVNQLRSEWDHRP